MMNRFKNRVVFVYNAQWNSFFNLRSDKFKRIALIMGGIVAFLIVASVVIILAAALSKYSDSSK